MRATARFLARQEAVAGGGPPPFDCGTLPRHQSGNPMYGHIACCLADADATHEGWRPAQ
eukprot:NODE_25607_length_581_cov_2.231278.p3 GENE.NODE_25607_length_581_cov_2.231278~~NODE_25607_length_581_cov_2.231278.p3  ORF type:complete len:59 (-),score=18.70 NODE_25607_length_581_cov_2.231278:209-385(-)